MTHDGVSTDPFVFRRVLGHFATGVTVVTGMENGEPAGFTCQAFSALSLDPAMIVIAPALASTSWPRIQPSGVFCVNVLAAGEGALARRFAARGGRKFDGVLWQPSMSGCPVLSGALAYVDCRLDAVYPGGDHVLAVGTVLDLAVGEGAERGPLLFYRGGFGHFAED